MNTIAPQQLNYGWHKVWLCMAKTTVQAGPRREFFPFLSQKSSPPQISNFANASEERQSNMKIMTQVWEGWGCKTASALAKRRTGRSESLNLWEGEETWQTKLTEPCLKTDKALVTTATKAKPEMWEHRQYSGSGLFKHCCAQAGQCPMLAAAGLAGLAPTLILSFVSSLHMQDLVSQWKRVNGCGCEQRGPRCCGSSQGRAEWSTSWVFWSTVFYLWWFHSCIYGNYRKTEFSPSTSFLQKQCWLFAFLLRCRYQ